MKFRKKPVVIEAFYFDGTSTGAYEADLWIKTGQRLKSSVRTRDRRDFEIETLEGTMTASPGDWIIRGVKGEFYPCKPDIFEATYEPAE